MSLFKIQINAGSPAVYSPNTITVYVNDSVFWFNGDPTNAHWPAPGAANPKGFIQYQVPPNSSSNQVGFPAPATIPYICVNHPGESGTIIVKTYKKSAFAGKTKKGAFAGATKKGGLKTKKTALAGTSKKGAYGKKTKK